MPEHYSQFGEAAGAAMAHNARTAARHAAERAAEEQPAEAPRNALGAPQAAEPPAPGPERHPGGENGPHTGTQDRAEAPPSTLPCACCCTDPNHTGRPDHCDPHLHRAFREAITRQWPGVAEYVMDDVLHDVVACHLGLAGRVAGAPPPAAEERRQRYARAMDAVTGGICPADLIDAVVAVADAEQAELRAALAIDTQVMEKADRECDEHIAAGRAFRQLAERTQAWGEQHRDRANRYRARVDRARAECDAIDREQYGQHDEDADGMREAVTRIRAALTPQAGDDTTGATP